MRSRISWLSRTSVTRRSPRRRETAQYAGDADPYKHPEERDDDEFDDDDEYDEYADDLDDDDVEGNGIGVETLEDDAENAADEATGDR